MTKLFKRTAPATPGLLIRGILLSNCYAIYVSIYFLVSFEHLEKYLFCMFLPVLPFQLPVLDWHKSSAASGPWLVKWETYLYLTSLYLSICSTFFFCYFMKSTSIFLPTRTKVLWHQIQRTIIFYQTQHLLVSLC